MNYKKIYTSAVLFLALLMGLQAQNEKFRKQAPAAGPAPRIQLGDFVDYKLDNGVTLIVVENHKTPRVSFRLFVDAPLAAEEEHVGAADLTGQLLRSGTRNMSKAQIDEAVDFIGAQLTTSSQGAFASGLSKHKDKLMGLLADVTQYPTFPEAEFDKVKKQMLSGLALEKDDAEAVAANVANVLRFGTDHPYGEVVSEQSVEGLSVQNCRAYYAQTFRPSNAYLVVVGDITVKEARQMALNYFGAWRGNSKQIAAEYYQKSTQPTANKVAFVPKTGAVQSTINITYPIRLKPGTDKAMKANLLNEILGSGFGGRLFQNIREDKGYTYGAYSSMNADKHIGYFNAYANVRNEVTDSSVTEFLYELEKIATELVTDQELDRAKNMITGSFARRLERPEAIARFALNTVRYGLDRDYYPTYLEKLSKVTKEELLELAKTYIRPENAHILVVGNKNIAETLLKFDGDNTIDYYDVYGQEMEMSNTELPEGVNVESVLQSYVKAIGGEKALRNINTVEVNSVSEVMGMKMSISLKQKDGDKLSNVVSMSGMVINASTVNGDEVKQLENGVAKTLDEQAKADLKGQAVFFPELDYAKYGYTAELSGIEQVDGKNAYVLNVNKPGDKQELHYYDTTSGLKVRTVATEQGTTITTDFVEYKEAEGVLFPNVITLGGLIPDTKLEVKVEALKVNQPIEDSVFSIK